MIDARTPRQGRLSAVGQWLLTALLLLLAAPVISGLVVGAVAYGIVSRDWGFLAPLVVGPVVAWWQSRRRPPLDGRLMRPAEEPQLAELVRTVAERAGFAAPLVVRVIPVPDATLAPTRVSGQRGFAMALGWPLVRQLPAQQLAAVIAHELAHHTHSGNGRVRRLLIARAALAARADRRLHLPHRLVVPLLRGTQPLAQQIELAADADAAAIAGTPASAAAIESTVLLGEAFATLAEQRIPPLLARGSYPEDFYAALGLAVDDVHVRRRLDAYRRAADALDDPCATHPSASRRIAALPAHPAVVSFGDAPVQIRAVAAIDAWAIEALTGRNVATLEPVRLADLDVDDAVEPVAEVSAALADATRRVTGSSDLETSLDLVTRPDVWPDVAERLEPQIRRLPLSVRSAARRDVIAGCLTIVLAARLAAAGWPPATRWATTIRTAPDGDVVDVRAVVEAALDSADASALRRLAAVGAPVPGLSR